MKKEISYLLVVASILCGCSPAPSSEQIAAEAARAAAEAEQAAQAAAPTPAAQEFACETGSNADGRVVDVSGSEHWLYSKPTDTSPRVLNQKASSTLGETIYHSVDSTTRVQVQCESGTWVRVQLTEPEWLTHVGGWVQSKYLLDPTKSGASREFTEADVFWDKDTKPHKQSILRAINEIHQSNPLCTGTLDPSSIAKSPSRSTAKRTLYFVTCGKDQAIQNVYFGLD